jgi:2-dehydro-3-deoxy-D-gluconate 5-dehydrogenase
VNALFSLEGQAALVTGGTRGIGKAIAVALAEAGADIAVTVYEDSLEAIREEVEARGRRFLAVESDLSRLDAVAAEALLDRLEGELDKVDILVNNAGLISRFPAEAYPDSEWDRVLAVNLDAVWKLSREAGRRMIMRGRGKIINIASLNSFQGGVNVPAYTVSKHGAVGLTRALANAWAARGVCVNAIAPGWIETNVTAALRQDEARKREIGARIPAGRWGRPEDVAGAAVFLAAPASDYVHGQVLVVDGGWLVR